MLHALPPRLLRRLFLIFAVITALPWLAVLISTLAAYSTQLEPEAARRLQAIGRTATMPLERAFGYGIPFGELRGMDPFLDQVLKDNPTLHSLSLAAPAPAPTPAPTSAPKSARPGTAPRYERTASGGEAGPATDLPVQLDGRIMAILHVVGSAAAAEQPYWAAMRVLLVALLVALIAGLQLMRCLLAILVTEPLRLADRILDAASAGDLTRVAGDAAGGGEIGGLLAAVNRLVRRAADRFEDVTAYAREIRAVVLDAAGPAGIDRIVAEIGRRVRLAEPIAEVAPFHARPMHGFAGFLAVVALILQLPALGRWGQAAGPSGEAVILMGATLMVLIPGRVWDVVARRIGRRGVLGIGLCLALVPVLVLALLSQVLLPLAGSGGKAALVLAALPWLAAIAGLAGMLRQGDWGRGGGGGVMMRMAMPGVACGCGLIAVLPQAATIDVLAALLTVATFLLLLPHPSGGRAVAGAARLDLPGLGTVLARVPAVLIAGLLLVLAHVSLFGIAAAILTGGGGKAVIAGRWADLGLYASAAILGGAMVEEARAISHLPGRRWGALWALVPDGIGAVLLLLVAFVVSPGAPALVLLGLGAGGAAAVAELGAGRVARTVRDRAVQGLARACGTVGAVAGLLLGMLLSVGDALAWLGLAPLVIGVAVGVASRTPLFMRTGFGRGG